MNSRTRVVDALRGFSLLGIILANLLIFQFGLIGKGYIEFFDLDALSLAVYYFIKICIEQSAMPIFTFLFGFSLIKLRDSLVRQGKKVKRSILRRAFLLMLFGILHGYFIWEGDILFFYGLASLSLVFLINRSRRFLIRTFVVTTLVTLVLSFVPLSDDTRDLLYGSDEITPDIEEYLIQAQSTNSSGTYDDIRYFSANVVPSSLDFSGDLLFLIIILGQLIVLPMFVLGMLVAKSDVLNDTTSFTKKYNKLVLLIPLGIVMKIPYHITHHFMIDGLHSMGSLLLSIGYIVLFVVIYEKHSAQFLFKSFEAVGRISLSNYIFQSVIMTLLFYGYGLGLFGTSNLVLGVVLAISTFVIQVGLSHYYLKVFKQGPLEYLLRIGTYLSLSGKPKQTND